LLLALTFNLKGAPLAVMPNALSLAQCYHCAVTGTYRVLTGPTAAGKTAALLVRATQVPLTVISADSRQVYCSMDIGTGKPTRSEQKILPHYGIDCFKPGISYSVYQFLIKALEGFTQAAQAGRETWVCGGTGLYIHALVDALELGNAPRAKLRQALAGKLTQQSSRQLSEELELSVTDPDNPVRVVRAAEHACDDTGRAASIYQWAGLDGELASQESMKGSSGKQLAEEIARWRCLGVAVLDPGREELARRIELRVRTMFETGLMDEVAGLRRQGFGDTDVVRDGIGYREAGAVLDGKLSVDSAIQATIIRTRQYAKRQRTYYRGRNWPVVPHQEVPAWIDATRLGRGG
jgi:tRNA dimethylallyltransferase